MTCARDSRCVFMRYTLPAKYNGVLLLLCGALLCAWYWEFCVKSHRSLWEVLPHSGNWLGFLIHSSLFILPAVAAVLLFINSHPRPQSKSARGVALLLLSTDTLLKSIVCFVLMVNDYWYYYGVEVLFLLPMVCTGLLWGLYYTTSKQRA